MVHFVIEVARTVRRFTFEIWDALTPYESAYFSYYSTFQWMIRMDKGQKGIESVDLFGLFHLQVSTATVASLITKILSLLLSSSAGKIKKPNLSGVYPLVEPYITSPSKKVSFTFDP